MGQAEPVVLEAGALLMEEGSPGDALYIVLEGEFEVSKRADRQDVVIAVRGPGEVLGEMSLLQRAPRSASVRALRQGRLLKVSQAAFEELLASDSSATLAILHTVVERLQNTEGMLRQHAKMAMLGTLAAGLAHELNNPAAAVRRSTAQLREALADWQRLSTELDTLTRDSRQAEALNTLRQEMVLRAAEPVRLSTLARSDRENDVQEWLEERGVDTAWELAPMLVSFGWDRGSLEKLTTTLPEGRLAVVVRWLGMGSTVHALLDEVGKGAERISEIVKAVKSYSYLDQAPIQEVDVHEGLENTLIILRHKTKLGVRVTRDYAPDLPRIEAYGSELNQVWTNIIDNALDAMQGQGDLVLRTYAKDGHVVVEVTDSGPGIPPEIQARIFEPFFTTKPPGQGTGLGLHITYNIVVHRHRGEVQVTSQPGATFFRVTLPVRLRGG
ncbi:MAG: cyclic nucleotide-binding domain-containing protein [Chloroflexi bacterium]|nr:cyclic nucleotide-binding domain-containing protein [Chloroflexota bacterium]